MRDAKEWIECMSYNFQGTKLAVGCHDNNIYLYNCAKNYQKQDVLRGHTSFVTALDWSLDGDFIRSVCGAYDYLFFSIAEGKQMGMGASGTSDIDWVEHSVKLGWAVEGIYPSGQDCTHINTVSQCKALSVLATGDDFGLVNVYRDPVRKNTH